MTDGIIQQVIDLHNKNECKCKHACHNLLRIQQEIIEKINKQMPFLGEGVMSILIGDNKE